MFFVAIFIFIASRAAQEILFPLINSNLQSPSDNQWYDCSTNTLQTPKICASSESALYDCFEIPDNGICTQSININQSQIILIQQSFYSFEECNLTIIFLNQTTDITASSEQGILLNVSDNPTTNQSALQISKKSNITVYVKKLFIYNSNNPPNCDIYNQTSYLCKSCLGDYTQYLGGCISDECIEYTERLFSQGVNSSIQEADQNIAVIYQFSSEIYRRDCYTVMVYLTKNFDDQTPIQLINSSWLSIKDKTQLQMLIPKGQIDTLRCDKLETFASFVTQCYFNVAVVIQGQIQYQLLQLFRLFINKQITTMLSIDSQQFDTSQPDQNQFSVLSDAVILNQTFIDTTLLIDAIQYIREPRFVNQTVQFKSATLRVRGVSYKLSLLNMEKNVENLSIFYQLGVNLSKSVITNLNQGAVQLIKIDANITEGTVGRILQDRYQLNYYLSNQVRTTIKASLSDDSTTKVQNQESQQKRLRSTFFSSGWIILIVVLTIISIFFATLLIKQLLEKKKNKKITTKSQMTGQHEQFKSFGQDKINT